MSGNTVMTAKNSFSEGLIMDFSPDNTQANCMTSALNATLLTFNGNEMSLQNDMGNGRVETAYLPDGYIPVGTCEFGDIIYIVSYNPLIDKAQIGCFPSPERNISSEELNNPTDTLKWTDFQKSTTNSTNGEPTGELIAASVKKILFQNDLHPGDKYIIASKEIDNSKNTISAYGSDKYDIEDFPKLVKIHVVSIEESGKINYLDSSVKWYDNLTDGVKTPYFISNSVSSNRDKIDIDSYRSLISSGYSVFSSKTSGQLALLVELEKITGFNCTWECFKTGESTPDGNLPKINYTNYDVFFNFNWTTNHNDINPNGAILEYSHWKNGEQSTTCNTWYEENDTLLLTDTNATTVQIPNDNVKEFLFSRHYCPENNITYDDYKNTYKYDVYVNKKFSDFNKLIRKVTNTGIPDFNGLNAQYVLNCDKIVINNGNLEYQSYNNGTYEKIEDFFTPNSSKLFPLKDSIINNKFNYPITKKLGTFTIPTHTYIKNTYTDTTTGKSEDIVECKENDLSKLVWQYKIVPTMPYGKLEEFAQEGYIDFSKIGKENIKLTSWKYYNYENTSTLTWAMDAYTDVGKVISSVEFEFYNKDGLVARVEHKGYNSYNGQFTDYLILNRERGNGNILNTDHDGNIIKTIDAGIIKSNNLYLVKINIYQGTKSPTGDVIVNNGYTKTEYRWFWTNQMFNAQYQYVSDFDNIQMTLGLDCNVQFSQTSAWNPQNEDIIQDTSGKVIDANKLIDSLSAIKQTIGYNDENNVQANLTISLKNTFDTFTLSSDSKFIVDTIVGNHDLTNVPENPTIRYSQEDTGNSVSYILPINDETLDSQDTITEGVLLNDKEGYKSYKNWAKLTLEDSTNNYNKDLSYVSSSGNIITLRTPLTNHKENITPSGANYNLNFKATHYSKYCYYTNSETYSCYTLRPFLYNTNDFTKYNLTWRGPSTVNQRLWFNECYVVGGLNKGDQVTKQVYVAGITEFEQGSYCLKNDDKQYSCNWTSGENYMKYLDIYKNATSDVSNWQSGTESTPLTKSINSFIFPYVFGWINSGHNQTDNDRMMMNKVPISLLTDENDKTYAVDGYQTVELTHISTSANENENVRYMSMCFKDELGNIYVNGPHSTNSVYKYKVKYEEGNGTVDKFLNGLVGIVTSCFYVSDNTEEEPVFYKSNYLYLDNNYSKYSADFVTNIKQGTVDVQINSISLNNLVMNIVDNAVTKTDDVSMKLKEKLKININVVPVFTECIKTFPIEIRINYIQPTFETKPGSGSNLILKSNRKNLPDISEIRNFSVGDIYVYNGSKFVPLGSNPTITCKTLKFNLDGSKLVINEELDVNTVNIDFSKLGSLFKVSDGTLVLKNIPSTNGTQDIITSRQHGKKGQLQLTEDSIRIQGFPKTMHLYKF